MYVTYLRKPYISFLGGKHVYNISFFILTFLCKSYVVIILELRDEGKNMFHWACKNLMTAKMVEVTHLLVKRDKFEFKLNLTHKTNKVQLLRVHTSIILIFA
jgi:hypothetical protein